MKLKEKEGNRNRRESNNDSCSYGLSLAYLIFLVECFELGKLRCLVVVEVVLPLHSTAFLFSSV